MTISAWDSFAVSEKWTMDDNNLLKLLFFVLFFFFSSSRWKPVSSSIKLSGRLLLWAADLSRNTKKRQIKSFSTELRFTFHWLLNSSEVLSVWWENVWWAYLRSEKKNPRSVFTQSLCLQFLSEIVFLSLSQMFVHTRVVLSKDSFLLSTVSLLLIFNTNKIDENIWLDFSF